MTELTKDERSTTALATPYSICENLCNLRIVFLHWRAAMAELENSSAGPADDELIDTLRLVLVEGVGPRTRQSLMRKFGSPRAVLAAAGSELRAVEGVGPKLMEKILAAGETLDVEEELALCRQHGIDILIESDPRYPRLLREIARSAGRAVCPRAK